LAVYLQQQEDPSSNRQPTSIPHPVRNEYLSMPAWKKIIIIIDANTDY